MMETNISTTISNEDTKYIDLLCDNTDVKTGTSETNNCVNSFVEIEAPLSPVLSNSRKSSKHIARRKSRIKLSNKFSQSSFSSQDSLQSQIHSEICDSELYLENETKVDNLEERMKKCIEMQKNKKFCYEIAKTSFLASKPEFSDDKIVELPSKSYISKTSVENKENDFNFKKPESPVSTSKLKNKIEKLESNINLKESNFNFKHSINLNVGFETGNGKKINLSDRALKRAAKLFDDIDFELSNSLNSNFDTKTSETTKTNDPIQTKVETNEQTFSGFKTANGNALKISEISLQKSKKLFVDICELPNDNNINNSVQFEKTNDCLKNKTQFKIPELPTDKNETSPTKNIDSKIFDQFEEINDSLENKTQFKILELPTDKNETSPTKNIDSKIFDDSYELPSENKINNSDQFEEKIDGMENNTQFKIPEMPTDKNETSPTKNIFSQITDSQICWAAENAECGVNFDNSQWSPSPKTKKTQLSEETNRDIDFLSPENENIFGNLTVCEDGSVRNRSQFKDENSDSEINFGFSKPKMSELKNTEIMFQDEYNNKKFEIFNKMENKEFEQIDRNLLCDDYLEQNINNNKQLTKCGFSTASGKFIKITDASLNKIKNIFTDCNMENENFESTNYNFGKNSENVSEINLEMSLLASVSVQSEFLEENIENLSVKSNFTQEFNISPKQEEDFCGFVFDDALKSLKILELYKRAFKYIEKDIKNNFFYPISFTFGDILTSKSYKNKNYKYSLRNRKKSGVIYTNKDKTRKKSNNSQINPEILNTSITTRSKRKSTNEELFLGDIIIDTQNTRSKKRKSQEMTQNSDVKTDIINKNIKKTIENLEDEFLNSIENCIISPEIFSSDSNENSCNNLEQCTKNTNFELSTTSEENNTEKNIQNTVQSHFNDYENTKLNFEFEQKNAESCIKNKCTDSDSSTTGKNVTMSKNAEIIFQDCETTEKFSDQNIIIPENQDYGFSTACGKIVQISEPASKKVNTIFQDSDLVNFNQNKEMEKHFDTSENTNLLGFSSASGKKVQISETALKKVKTMFQDSDLANFNQNMDLEKHFDASENTNLLGFSSASGKQVQISETALKKVKTMFQDSDLANFNQNMDLEKHFDASENTNLLGFSSASGKKVQISETALKKVKTMFQDSDLANFNQNMDLEKHFDASENTNLLGFSSASGKKVQISETALKKVKTMFQDSDLANFNQNMDLEKHFDASENTNLLGFSSASGKQVQISEEALTKSKTIFQDSDLTNFNQNMEMEKYFDTSENNTLLGFSSASGKKVQISEEALKKVKTIFQDSDLTNFNQNIDIEKCDASGNTNLLGFSSASGKKVQISEEALKKVKTIFQDSELENNCDENVNISKNVSSFGYSSASGNKIMVSESALKKVKNIFEDNSENLKLTQKSMESAFSTASGKDVNIPEESLNKVRNIFNEVYVDSVSKNEDNTEIFKKKITECNTPNNVLKVQKSSNKSFSSPQALNNTTPILRKNLSARKSKKRNLGVTSCKQINIEENTLKRAKLVFDDLDTTKKKDQINNHSLNYSVLNTPSVSRSSPSICSQISKQTPSKSDSISPQSLLNSSISMKETNHMIKLNLSQKISPVKICLDQDSVFQFRESTQGDVKKWTADLQKELEMLKLKMSVIETRVMMMNKQQEIIESGSSDHRRQRPGHLFNQKLNTSSRISLKEAVNNKRPQKNTYQICQNMGLDISLLNITPENSSTLHFHVPWWINDNRTYPAVIRTEDGAVVIPNQQNFVGVCEIEQAFLAMPGVAPSLVPKKWVGNHYRWIVWKLASMERNYPDVFKDYLSVENVMAQLKYRYDREIDRAQRSAIKKIVECDDTATKRMVLCVASIFKTENQHELELTDGWYIIRTIIDTPLNSLVEKGLIKIGMKLITQGAELLNCEGCCPLELPSNVRLQIHFNSTRRAAWHLKLGFSSNPGPLLISLHMVSGSGGPIGGTIGYIARLYPISYMERGELSASWRNERAEIRRANQWESEYANTMENVQAKVEEELEKEWRERDKKKGKLKLKDMKGVQCGKTLYQFLEESNDPDSVKEMLTSAQISSLQEYQIKLNLEHQTELSSRLREKLSNENIKPRDVCTVLKLLLVDVQKPYHSRSMTIWRPTESHSQMLKEGNVINIFNATAKINGTLSTNKRTQFEENCDYDSTRYGFLNRVVTPISQTCNTDFKPKFGEFDTVGMVVSVDVQQNKQSLWMADENQRFLSVIIRDGPNTCILLDGVTPGKIVSVINLIYKKPMNTYGESIGNYYTVLSSYPQQTYLQEYMQEFINNLPQDVDLYLEECQNKIQSFISNNTKSNSNLFPFMNNSTEENELFSKKLLGLDNSQQNKQDSPTLSDEEMALLDTQVM